MSADQDFLQLVNDRVTVWSPIKKIFYTPEKVLEDYGVPAHNFLMYKILMGDKSDNLEGVKGLGPKKLPKILPDISSKLLNGILEITMPKKEVKESYIRRIKITNNKINRSTNKFAFLK